MEPDVVMACAGDMASMESFAAVAILKERFASLKICFVNVVDLFRPMPDIGYRHGLSDRDFDSLFTVDKPVIFNFHSCPSLVHKLGWLQVYQPSQRPLPDRLFRRPSARPKQ